jgi:hypothetical protein
LYYVAGACTLHRMDPITILCANDPYDALTFEPAGVRGERLDAQLDTDAGYVALTPTTAREAARYLLAWADFAEGARLS